MQTKLHLIRYYYSEMSQYSKDGGAFMQPMFFAFPDDADALSANPSLNVMISKALKLSI